MVDETASRQQLLTAAKALSDLLPEQMSLPHTSQIFKPLGDSIHVLEKILRVLEAHEATGDEQKKVFLHEIEAEQNLQALKTEWVKHSQKLDRHRERLIQTYLQKLVEYHDEETKEWFFMEVLARYSSHMTEPKDPKPVVTVTSKNTAG